MYYLATSSLQSAVAKLEARIKTLEVDDKKDAQTTQPEKVLHYVRTS